MILIRLFRRNVARMQHNLGGIYVGFAWKDLRCRQEALFSSVATSWIEGKNFVPLDRSMPLPEI